MSAKKENLRRQENRAAIFVDFDDLLNLLAGKNNGIQGLDQSVAEMLAKLRVRLLEEYNTQTTVLRAYADFGEIEVKGLRVHQALFLQGVEARFVPVSLQKNAAEIQLCVDSVDLIHNRLDIDTFVVVTGNRAYLPLIQHVIRSGRTAMVVGFGGDAQASDFPVINDSIFLNAAEFFESPLFQPSSLQRSPQVEAQTPESRNGVQKKPDNSAQSQTAPHPTRKGEVTYKQITGHTAYRMFELIEEHFGQYDEIYLTPLLRKLSEEMNDPEFDPKTVISELEEAGAIWLEKRRGHPYDYTVLLIDGNHPDALQIKETFSERNRLREAYGDILVEDFDADESLAEEDFFSQPVEDGEKADDSPV